MPVHNTMGTSIGSNRDLGDPPGKGSRVVAWLCYFLMGAGVLAPWNALITAADYMEAMWPGRHMSRLITITCQPAELILLLICMKLSSWTRLRLLTAYGGFTVVLTIIPLIDLFVIGRSEAATESAFGVILALSVLVGVFGGFGEGAMYGDASLLPPVYTHAVVGGTASAGTLICIIRAITKAAAPETPEGTRRASDAYFFMAVAIAAACFIVYGWVVPRLAVVKYYRKQRLDADFRQLPVGQPDAKAVTPAPSPLRPDDVKLHTPIHTPPAEPATQKPQPLTADNHQVSIDLDRPFSVTRPQSIVSAIERTASAISLPPAVRALSVSLLPPYVPPPTLMDIWKLRWRLVCAMFLVYATTLAIFPGFLAEDVKNAALGSWYTVILFMLYNVGDMVGKMAPHFNLAPGQTTLLLCAVARLAFFPAFFCAARFGAPPEVMGALTLLLGLSNGYLTALCLTRSPVGLSAIQSDLAANMLIVGLAVGINVGCYTGWLWLLRSQ